jgi:hypothetical protein
MNERLVFHVMKVALTEKFREIGPDLTGFSMIGWKPSAAHTQQKKAA